MKVSIHEAKTNLSKLLARVSAGEEVIIVKNGKPVARLVPVTPKQKPRKLGAAAGKIYIAPDFDSPLPEHILQDFGR
jgi:prevent-host-death family protein